MGNAESSSIPYTLQDQIQSFHSSIGWTLHNGIETATGQQVSLFAFDKTKHPSKVECARNGMVMLRQLRHPFVLKYINGIEQPNMIYIVTEPIEPFTLPYKPPEDSNTNAFVANKSTTSSSSTTKQTLSSQSTTNNYHSNDSTTPNVTQNNVLTSSSLDLHLKPLPSSSPEAVQLLISSGLYQIYTAIDFINTKANLIHGNINPSSIFVSKNGDWKLGGFDLAFKPINNGINKSSNNTNDETPADTNAFLDLHTNSTPNSTTTTTTKQQLIGTIALTYRSHYSSQLKEFLPPDVLQNQWKKLESYPLHVIDAYSIGQFLRLLLNPSQNNNNNNSNSNNNKNHSSSMTIPPLLLNDYKLYFPIITSNDMNPLSTLPTHQRILQSSYFNNHVIAALTFLDESTIKTVDEKKAFFTQFSTIYTMFPTSILRNRIIPQLILSFDLLTPKTAGNSFAGILNSTFAVSKVCLPLDEYNKSIVPLIKKLFQSPDLDVRMSLLSSIKEFAQFLTIDMVFNEILPTIVIGIYDINPIIRELTIIGLISFYPQFLKVKNGEYDTAINNITIMSNKVAYDAYNYATTTYSYLSSYLGYLQNNNNNNNNNQTTTNNNDSTTTNNTNSSMVGISSQTMNKIGNNNTTTTTQTGQQNQSSPTATTTTTTSVNPHLYTLPSLYLPQIIFPSLIEHFPNELLPNIRQSILLTATSLAQLLPLSIQETLLLTIYAKGMKDNNIEVRKTALDGLIISLLTSSFTIHTLCNKIIPFTCSFICDKNQDISFRAIYVLQYSLHKIQHQYCSSSKTQNNNIIDIIQGYPIKYPMLQLDLSHLTQQAQQIVNNNHTTNNNSTTTPIFSTTTSSSSSSFKPHSTTITSSSTTTTNIMPIPTQLQLPQSTGNKNKESLEISDETLQNAFPNLVQTSPTSSIPSPTPNNSNNNNNNVNKDNNNSMNIEGYEDWSSLHSPLPAATSSSTSPIQNNNNINNINNKQTQINTTNPNGIVNNNNNNLQQKKKVYSPQTEVQLDFELDQPIQNTLKRPTITTTNTNTKSKQQLSSSPPPPPQQQQQQHQQTDIFESFQSSPTNNTTNNINTSQSDGEWAALF